MSEVPKDAIKCLNHGFVRLIGKMGDDAAIVQAARVSYGKGTKKHSEDRALIRYLMRAHHTSPFEMAEFKFHAKMPIFVARQWVRTRMANLNEVSSRYSELPSEFYVPEKDRLGIQSTENKQGTGKSIDSDKANQIIQNITSGQEFAKDQYKLFLHNPDEGSRLSKELARINLPVSIYTEWYWKIDLHNLFHFLTLRMDKHAQWEIRVYAEAIYELIKPIVPLACEAFEDYRLNSKSFSSAEMDVLRQEDVVNAIVNTVLEKGLLNQLSSREIREFKNKLGIKSKLKVKTLK